MAAPFVVDLVNNRPRVTYRQETYKYSSLFSFMGYDKIVSPLYFAGVRSDYVAVDRPDILCVNKSRVRSQPWSM